MSKLRVIAVLALLGSLSASTAQAARLKVKHDRDVDLGAYRTFQYVPSKEHTIQDPTLDKRVVAALEEMLKEGGLASADANPDAFATYHINLEVENNFSQDRLGYDVGTAWGLYGSGTASTDDYWTQGTLIVDLWDAKTEKAIWRGTAVQKLKKTADQRFKQLQKALDQMLAKWQKMRGDGG